MSAKNLVGKKFNKLLVLSREPNHKNGQALWICMCECGKKVIRTSNVITNGKSKSCGCMKRGLPPITIIGNRYGSLVVVGDGYIKNYTRHWECVCDCGIVTHAKKNQLTSGAKKSCGCLQKSIARNAMKLYNSTNDRFSPNKTLNPRIINGYIKIHDREHPACDKGGFVFEHTVVMEQKVGRLLDKDETVHHKNGDRADNRIENLELWSTNHPSGQRIEDKVLWAKEILEKYKDFV